MKAPTFATLSMALLLCLSALTAQVNTAPDGVSVPQYIPAQSNSRSHCQTHSMCEFYSHCIESAFHCGTQGFAISYAKQRCAIIKKLRPVGNSAYSVSRNARRWARDTETCLHTRLRNLLQRYNPAGSHPDPQTCLTWEMDAIAELNTCYTNSTLGTAFLGLPEADIRKLVSLFRVSEYYGPTVDAGLVELIKTKSMTLASEVVRNHALSSRHRIILCVKGTKYDNEIETTPSPEEYVRIVSANLAPEESEYFHSAGSDLLEDMAKVGGLCQERSRDIDVNADKDDYHLVTWFTTDHSRDDIGRVDIRHNDGILVNGNMFELTTVQDGSLNARRKITQCGDGIRQVSEACDFAGNYPGCNIDCEMRDGYDCNTEKLEPSRCWREVCGDGLRTRGERCDDGNDSTDDGCDNQCRIDSDTHKCSTVYNATSLCIPLSSRQLLPGQPQPAPARLISQAAGSSGVASPASSSEGVIERTVFSSGYRPTAILAIILGMVGVAVLLNLR